MLVIAVDTTSTASDALHWVGRRHDDDAFESTGEPTARGLFDTVFAALHDGEQVSIGFDCPLTASAGVDPLDAAGDGPALAALRWLITEVGTWRPWTIVTTSLPRWRATTSVLVWEAGGGDAAAAVDGFYALLRADAPPVGDAADGSVNLAAAIAVASDATADEAEVRLPVLRVAVTAAGR